MGAVQVTPTELTRVLFLATFTLAAAMTALGIVGSILTSH